MNDDLKWAVPDRYDLLKLFSRKNRLHPTFAEQLLWQYLRDQALGTKFFRQYVIADYKYKVDFVSLQHNLVIEVDGAYHSEYEQMEYDELRTQRLESFGFNVIRFSNEQVQNDMPTVIDSIQSMLRQLTKE